MPSDRNVPHSPTLTDLDDADNQIQARHELHRARDFGGDAELAAWARKWGESALQRRGAEADGLELDKAELTEAQEALEREKGDTADAISEASVKLRDFMRKNPDSAEYGSIEELDEVLSEHENKVRNL